MNYLKLIQTDQEELSEFNYAKNLMKKKSDVDESKMIFHAHTMDNSHLNFTRNKLYQQLSIKILIEEKKYVYFVAKLTEYSGFVRIVFLYIHVILVNLWKIKIEIYYYHYIKLFSNKIIFILFE